MPFLFLQAAASPSFADELGNMLYRYVTATAPFALAHLLIVYNVFVSSRRIGREIQALNRWPQPAGVKADSAAALTQFIEECSIWGSRGILVPMTDFSDRLDASVTAFVDNLHARMNLFLVVGVAGTFFALFSALSQPGVDYRTIAAALPNALPVGFVGLVLSLGGHYLAFKMEHSFRDAVSKGTQRALAKRMDLARSPSDTIREAIEQLSSVLQKSLEPVLERLEDKIQDATRVTSEQIQPLSNAIGDFSGAIKELKSPLELMHQSVEKLPAALGRLEEIEGSVQRMVAGTAVAMESVEARLSESAGGLADLTGKLVPLPELLTSVVGQRLQELARGTAEVWTRHTEHVLADIRPAAETLTGSAARLHDAAGRMEEANTALQGTADELRSSFQAANADLVASCGTTWTAAVAQMATSGDAVYKRLEEAAAGLIAIAGEMRSSFQSANADLVASCGAAWTTAAGQMAAGGDAVCNRLEETSGMLLSTAAEVSAGVEKQTTELASRCYTTWRDTGEQFARNQAASLTSQLSAIQEAANKANRSVAAIRELY